MVGRQECERDSIDSETHILCCRYCSTVSGFGPPNQSIRNMSANSNLNTRKSWPLGQPVKTHEVKWTIIMTTRTKMFGYDCTGYTDHKAFIPCISGCFVKSASLAIWSSSVFPSTITNYRQSNESIIVMQIPWPLTYCRVRIQPEFFIIFSVDEKLMPIFCL